MGHVREHVHGHLGQIGGPRSPGRSVGEDHGRLLIELTIAPSGFEPLSPAPKAGMLGLYTTGLVHPPATSTKE